MAKTGLIATFERLLLREATTMSEHAEAPTAEQVRASRRDIHAFVQDVGKSGDLDLILTIEKDLLQNDLNRHANSTGMTESLKDALADLGIAQKHVALVREPAAYGTVNAAHSRERNRLPKGSPAGVPNDEARQFFKSHSTRLLNQDRSRLEPEEKLLLDQRRANLRAAEKLYATLQREALGLPAPQSKKSKSMGM